MKLKTNHKKSYYNNTFWNLLIYFTTFILLLIILAIIFIVFRFLFLYVFKVEKSISNMVSLVVSIMLVLIPSLHKIKIKLYRFIAVLQQLTYKLLRKRIISKDHEKSIGQTTVINKAIGLLQNPGSSIVSLEGKPGKGKTMTSVFLVDDIGRDKKLLDLFIELQRHIYYLDAGQEIHFLTNVFSEIELEPCSLVFIDNLHKISVEKLNIVLEQVKSVSEYANESGKKSLVILIHQSILDSEQVKHSLMSLFGNNIYNDKENLSFTIDELPRYNESVSSIKNKIDQNEELLKILMCEYKEPMRSHLLNMYKNNCNNSLFKFIFELLNNNVQKHGNDEQKKVYFIAAIVMLSKYYGFVTKESIQKILATSSVKFNILQYNCYLNMFSKIRFLQPFPLRNNSYIFNESLATEYRRKLSFNELFCEYCDECSYSIFSNDTICHIELKWLYLISCNTEVLKRIPAQIKKNLFYICTESLNLNYVLASLENELQLQPTKYSLFQIELGILYIKTGKWKEARNTLKPYIYEQKVEKEIWELQLQIIEADHGVDDEENYSVIKQIISASDDPFIVFQAKYWLAHIDLEQGNFSLDIWAQLQKMIKENKKWKEKSTYSHMVHRITADTCRTFFLKGENKPNVFVDTIRFFESNRIFPETQEDLALSDLEEAHYIHYELVYQLGIWNMYRFAHDKTMSNNDRYSLDELINIALNKYALSITRFFQSGVKTWRTAQIRSDELSLTLPTPNFVEILGHLDDFEQYAIDNHVDVFVGYVKCLQGKALSIYAYTNHINAIDSTYEYYLNNALEKLHESSETYEKYGNTYGKLRSDLLYILVESTAKISTDKNKYIITSELVSQINELKSKFNNDNNRELQIMDYLTSIKSLKLLDLIKVIKYYPIVLQ